MRKLASGLWMLFLVGLVAYMLTATTGCSSAVQAINADAETIDELAQASEGRFSWIAETTTDDDIRDESKDGIADQRAIQSAVAGIRDELPRVEDRQPWWAAMVGRVALAGVLIAALLLLWQTGLGHLLRRLVYSVSWMIPQRARRAAAIDRKLVEDDDPANIREAIAVRRSSDPAYDAAWLKLKHKD